jgi:hypothetical protein
MFELATDKDAATLVAFERRVADPKLYGPPLDLRRALQEITNNSFYFIKKDDTMRGTRNLRTANHACCSCHSSINVFLESNRCQRR